MTALSSPVLFSQGRPFLKMHGLGNDFVVLDSRGDSRMPDSAETLAIANRHTGVGCDQLIVLLPARDAHASAYVAFRNSDGAMVDACGNGSRCAAALLMRESGQDHILLETGAGLIEARDAGNGLVTVDMGPARLAWNEIPLAGEVDTLHLPVTEGALSDPVGVSMGNPHAVFFVPDAEAIDLAMVGPRLEHHALFPQRANIEFAQITAPGRIRMRVWERGAGVTQACGTGACATLVAAARRGLSGREAELILDGGSLFITWREDGHVVMTGPVAESFAGTLSPMILP